ncbi:glycosyltransferase family 4 protein [Thermodesulfobacteriota bacterium]
MIKKLIAISNHGAILGGGEHSFLDLLSHLSDPWNVLAVVPEEGELAARLEKKDVKSRVISLPSIKPWYFLDILSSLKNYFNLCRRTNATLIYANGSRAAFYAGIVGRILKIPMIWHCRITARDPFLDFVLCGLSSCIIANSKATKMRFNSRIQRNVRVVYNGIDLHQFQVSNIPKPALVKPDWKVVLSVARASRWKKHDLLLSAFEIIAKAYQNAHLICLGSPDSLEPDWWRYLQDCSKKSDHSERIHWVGQVDDVRPWYRAADVMVLPSENEPFGRVLVEAMASGVPVVASGSGGIPEIIRHKRDGLLVYSGNKDEFAQAVINIFKNHHLRKKLILSGLERSKMFGIKAHTEGMIEVFNTNQKK